MYNIRTLKHQQQHPETPTFVKEMASEMDSHATVVASYTQ